MVTICERSSGCGTVGIVGLWYCWYCATVGLSVLWDSATVGIVGVWYCGYCQDCITLSLSDGKVQINILICETRYLVWCYQAVIHPIGFASSWWVSDSLSTSVTHCMVLTQFLQLFTTQN